MDFIIWDFNAPIFQLLPKKRGSKVFLTYGGATGWWSWLQTGGPSFLDDFKPFTKIL